jgi:hypothetical protein
MNISRGKREHAEAEPADDPGEGGLSRRRILGGLVALPVLYGIGSATPALAGASTRPGRVPSGSVSKVTDDLVRGVERRYNAPLLTPGTRVVLPAGIKVVPIQDYYRHPHLAAAESAWPLMTATDGTTVDASIVPERGAPTRIAMLNVRQAPHKFPPHGHTVRGRQTHCSRMSSRSFPAPSPSGTPDIADSFDLGGSG